MAELKQTVFIIDDDEAVRDSLRMLLRSVGLPVTCFESAQTFLDEINLNTPGCLVLDIRMPGLSGMELAQRMRDQDSLMPIIFITGHGDVPMAVEAMKMGALDFLQKPFRDQDLLDRIQQALQYDADRREQLTEREQIRQRMNTLTPREELHGDTIRACEALKDRIDAVIGQLM